jgi:putative MATE family efflux protein
MRRGKDLTKGHEAKVIVKFAIPMMIGNIFQQFYNVVDSAIVGKFVGKEALAATGVSFPVLFAINSVIIGFAMGGMILISQFYGAKKIDKVKQTADTMQILMLLSALVLTVVGISTSHYLFRALNFPEENIHIAVKYFNILMFGNVLMFGYNSMTAMLRGLGDSQTPLYFMIISNIVNVVGDLVFVIVFKWGIEGAAWATVFSYFVAYASGVIYLNKKHKIIRINFKIKFNKEIYRKIMRTGLPTSGQMLLVSLGNVLFFMIINMFGTNVIAGYTAAGRINAFAIMPAMFFANALTAFTGQNFGAGKIDRIKRGIRYTLVIVIGISLVISAVSLVFPASLIGLFTNDANVVQIGVEYFYKVAPFYFVFAVMFAFNGLYRGIGDTLTPMFFTLIALWIVRFPVAVLLSMSVSLHPLHFTPVNPNLLWWSEPLGWTVGMLLATTYFVSGKWQKKQNLAVNFDRK